MTSTRVAAAAVLLWGCAIAPPSAALETRPVASVIAWQEAAIVPVPPLQAAPRFELLLQTSEAPAESPGPGRRSWKRWLLYAAGGAVVAGAVAYLATREDDAQPRPPTLLPDFPPPPSKP